MSQPVDQDPELLLNLQNQLRLQRALVDAIKRDGLAFYKPHPKQDLFHRAGDQRRRALFSGNRFGKSQCGCAEDCSWLRGERVFYPHSDPARKIGIPDHPVKGLVITTDWDKVDEIWTSERGDRLGKVWKYLPSGFVKSKRRNHSGAVCIIECANGSLLQFDTVKSWMSNPMGSESSDWDFIHVDEPCPEGMFKGASRGLIDRRGSAWFTLTALSEPWIIDMFFAEGYGTISKERTWAITGTIYDNPYLSREAIADYESTLTEDEKQCRLYGIPLHLAGLVYKTFDRSRHLLTKTPLGWSAPEIPPSNYTLYVTIDPHPQTPHMVLFCAVAPTNQRFYYFDLFEQCSIKTLCEKIRNRCKGYKVGAVRIDPLAYIRDPVTERCMADEFHRCGIMVEKAVKDLEGGIIRVNQELSQNPGNIFFLPSARRTLWEIQRYCWDPDGSNKPIDRDDHAMECLYRSELEGPRWLDPDNYTTTIDDLVIDRTETQLEDLGYLKD